VDNLDPFDQLLLIQMATEPTLADLFQMIDPPPQTRLDLSIDPDDL
jgi:hypothetical protein